MSLAIADQMLRMNGLATIWEGEDTDCSYMPAIMFASVEYAWCFESSGRIIFAIFEPTGCITIPTPTPTLVSSKLMLVPRFFVITHR